MSIDGFSSEKAKKLKKSYFTFGHPTCTRKWPKLFLIDFFMCIGGYLSEKAKKSNKLFLPFFQFGHPTCTRK
jgi:hypothetical protein